ncbi:MAG: conserved hypothetical outer membrane protein [Bacteroidota bacterium]|jgi:TonB family protein|nr:conserved hypothetical outer membrane protein [Bacteroidota bacterium]
MKLLVMYLCLSCSCIFAQSHTTIKERKVDKEIPPVAVVDQSPEYPDEATMRYVVSNLQYPQEAKEKGCQGNVYLEFIVETDGSITDLKVVNNTGCPEFEQEAVRVVKMLKFNPAIKDGIPVRATFHIPVKFRLS